MVVEKLDRALGFMESNDARRLERMKRDVDHLLISSVGWARHIPPLRSVLLSEGYIRQSGAKELSTALVHEATPARMENRGIRYAAPFRKRIEVICVREQARFARRLPDGAELAAEVEKLLELEWWEEEHRRDRTLWVLRELGCGPWLLRFRQWVGTE